MCEPSLSSSGWASAKLGSASGFSWLWTGAAATLTRGSANVVWILEIYMECTKMHGCLAAFLSLNYLNSIRVSICCAAEGNRKYISGPVMVVLNSFIVFSNCIGCKEQTPCAVQRRAAKRWSQKSLQKNWFPFLRNCCSRPWVKFPWLWAIAAAIVTKYSNSSSCYQNNSENGNNSRWYQFCLILVISSHAPLSFEFPAFLTFPPPQHYGLYHFLC